MVCVCGVKNFCYFVGKGGLLTKEVKCGILELFIQKLEGNCEYERKNCEFVVVYGDYWE